MMLRYFVSLAAAVAAVLAPASAIRAESTTLRMRGVYAAEDTSSKAMKIFKVEAERLSGGRSSSSSFQIRPALAVTLS
jgi:TRAP-type C4-dicarboxylate transport system substrate-binding protein